MGPALSKMIKVPLTVIALSPTMGPALSKMIKKLFDTKKDTRILMVGLDAAGKTTILYKLKLGDIVTTIPTIGFNVETLEYKKLRMTVWDIGGQDKIRPLWKHYYIGTQGIIYVVDSNDVDRIDCKHETSAKEELHRMIQDDELRGCPVLVLANKQDLPRALNVREIAQRLGMDTIKNRTWHVQACTAKSGDGLYEGLDWLNVEINRKK